MDFAVSEVVARNAAAIDKSTESLIAVPTVKISRSETGFAKYYSVINRRSDWN